MIEFIILGFGLLVLLIGLIFAISSFYLVRQSEAIVIERFGRYDRTLLPGLHVVVPFIETPHTTYWTYLYEEGKRYHRLIRAGTRIDLREAVYDFPKQNVITKDNVTIEINALLYYQITDPKAAVYEVANLPEAIEKLTQTTLRNVIGSMDLDETLVSRDLINHKLRIILDEATDKWGVKVNRVELQEVNPPHDIRSAMEKQMRAERDRRAVILEAEGRKRAAVLDAEGLREAEILKAEGAAQAQIIEAKGEAEARLKITDAEAQAIQRVREAMPNCDPLPYLLAVQYIKSLPEMMQGKNDKVILMPYETSALMGSLGSIKTLFDSMK
jgi:regulator of protease activity HflC (stomatin/prohibitin superfamily)